MFSLIASFSFRMLFSSITLRSSLFPLCLSASISVVAALRLLPLLNTAIKLSSGCGQWPTDIFLRHPYPTLILLVSLYPARHLPFVASLFIVFIASLVIFLLTPCCTSHIPSLRAPLCRSSTIHLLLTLPQYPSYPLPTRYLRLYMDSRLTLTLSRISRLRT